MKTLSVGINIYKGYIVNITLVPVKEIDDLMFLTEHSPVPFKLTPGNIYQYDIYDPDGFNVDGCLFCPEDELTEIEQEILGMIEFDITDRPRFAAEQRKAEKLSEQIERYNRDNPAILSTCR